MYRDLVQPVEKNPILFKKAGAEPFKRSLVVKIQFPSVAKQ
jgi:hypothetical protein